MFPSSFEMKRDKTRLEVTSRIAKTVTRLLMSGLVAREKSGKILNNQWYKYLIDSV